MKIIPLSEGRFTIDQTKLFVPFDPDRDELHERSRGSLLVEIQPFVVVTSRDVLLLDTGLGFDTGGRMQIHDNLLRAGIEPEQVTRVLLTHLHKDHAGGIADNRDRSRLAFPRAKYYVQQREIDFAFEKGMPSFVPEELELLRSSDQVVPLQDDGGRIEGYIDYELSGAHSPWHQVFWIREAGQTIFFGGDEAPQLQQMRHRFVAKYDVDGKKAMHLRQQWWQLGEKENWTFLFYHDIQSPVFSF